MCVRVGRGVHFGTSDAALASLARFVERIVSNWAEDPSTLPQLWWRETLAQHFPRSVWTPHAHTNGAACSDISFLSANLANSTGPYNAVTEPVTRRFGLRILRGYRASVPLHEAHLPPDCTHYCPGASGPDTFALALLAAMLEKAVAIRQLPPPEPMAALQVSARWRRLLEDPDSVMARLQECGSEHLVREWATTRPRDPMPCALVKCMRSSLGLLRIDEMSMHLDRACDAAAWQPPLRHSLSYQWHQVIYTWSVRFSCKYPNGLCGTLGVDEVDGRRVLSVIALAALLVAGALLRRLDGRRSLRAVAAAVLLLVVVMIYGAPRHHGTACRR